MKAKGLISILGAGNHGTLLTLLISKSNKYNVKLLDTTEESLSHSHMLMESLLHKELSNGKIDHHDYFSIFENISVSTDISSVLRSDYVIECVGEYLPLKTKLISDLDAILPKDSLIFSTTMSLSITRLAAASSHPGRIAGLHFFSLATASKVVEIVSGLQTSAETLSRSCEFVASLGRSFAVSKDSPGFIANKIVFSFINESINSLAEGVANKEDIDKTLKIVTGMDLGPLEMADEIGLDVVLDNLRTYHKELGDDRYRPSALLVNHVAAGWTGKRSGRGFYEYRIS